MAWIFAAWNFAWFGPGFDRAHPDFSRMAEQMVDPGLLTLLFAGEMIVGGWLVAGTIFGIYLTISALTPPRFSHIDEAFSAQAIEDFKNFLRIKIDGLREAHSLSHGRPQDTAVVASRQKDRKSPRSRAVVQIQ